MTIRLLILAFMMMGATAYAADPVVSNIVSAQRTDGSKLVDIHYDLTDADADTCHVSINVSENGGQTWLYPCITLTGDAGDGIAPGVGKLAVWDFGRDHAGAWGDSFQVQVIASDSRLDWRTHSPNTYSAHHWGPSSWDLSELPEQLARADVVTITARVYWDNGPLEAFGIVDAIKAINPDCTVLCYVPVSGIPLFFGTEPEGSFGKLFYDATRPYWSYTTTGDTLMSWPNTPKVNILDPDCRETLVSVFADYYAQSETKFDGIFYDYFPDYVWIPEWVSCEGEADLDLDGIPQLEDADEMAAYDNAQEAMIALTRAAMGDTFPLVCNGVRAQRDSVFAAMIDGINYELFPTLRFNEPQTAAALDVDLEYSLWHSSTWPRTQAGGPYILLENIQRYNFVDNEGQPTPLSSGNIFRVIGLLVDNIYPVWESSGGHAFDWPALPLNLGEPQGPTLINGDVFTRQFTYGDVWMEMKSGHWPNPFRYRITLGGEIVEELDTPYHYP